MRENAKPKRHWFRFHLLTAVLMMAVASGLLGTNVLVIQRQPIRIGYKQYEFRYGFPLASGIGHYKQEGSSESFFLDSTEAYLPPWVLVILNVLANFGIVMAVAVVSELVIRRREPSKP
jgi:hypothetical protein